jgi:CRP/FNR family transcriptional regulator/CRP/FNR family cyclic AMP-dependent transcriptional regulator
METKIKLLKSVDLFSPLYDEHLTIFAKIANYKCYLKGELVLQQNDTENQSFFLIASGQAKVFISGVDGTEVTLEILNPGEFFGEMSLLDGEPRSASVIAVQESNLLVIRRDDFLNELEKNSRLAKILLIEMSRRIRNKNNELANLELISAYGKVTTTLMDIVKENGTHSCLTDGTDVNITKNCPSQQQIADMSGTTKETVSDAINYLQKQGIIVLNDDELCVFKKTVLNISE